MVSRLTTNPPSTSPSSSILQPISSMRPSVTHSVSPGGNQNLVRDTLDTWQHNEFIHHCFTVLQIRYWYTAWWVAAGQPLWFWPTWWWNTAYLSWTLLSMCDSAVASCPTTASWSSSEPWTSRSKRRGWGKEESSRSSSFPSDLMFVSVHVVSSNCFDLNNCVSLRFKC